MFTYLFTLCLANLNQLPSNMNSNKYQKEYQWGINSAIDRISNNQDNIKNNIDGISIVVSIPPWYLFQY